MFNRLEERFGDVKMGKFSLKLGLENNFHVELILRSLEHKIISGELQLMEEVIN